MTIPNFLDGLSEPIPGELSEALMDLRLIDHHVHGSFTEVLDRSTFEESINEGSLDSIPAFMTQFDSQVGLAIRRWCAPELGLAPRANADEYWTAREQHSVSELNKVFLPRAGVERWIIDTGFSGEIICTPEVIAQDSRSSVSEIVRLETVAESLIDSGIAARDFADAFRAALTDLRPLVVGFKTIAAYRTGLDIDWAMPDPVTVATAVREVSHRAGSPRIAHPALSALLVNIAAEQKLPLQFHIGFGDRDIDLHRANPMLLLPLLRNPAIAKTPVMLLHCYPFHREAGYLAQSFPNVYFDVGLTLNYVGSQSRQIIAESLELAPFGKQLYSSDAFGPPELHLLGSILWRRSMAQVLGGWVSNGDLSVSDASRVTRLIGHNNAARIYGITAS